MKKTPAVSYLRVSGKAQAGADKDGFPRQREAVAKFAQRNGHDIVGEFRDEGVSGTRELENRPALAALIDRIASNGVRIVLVERADRLARDLMIGEVILRELSKRGARVLTADGQDLTTGNGDPTRKLIRQVLGAVSEFEKSVLVLKLRAARDRKRGRGERVEGVKPFGFFPGERAIIERMRALRRKPRKGAALSFAEVAAALNAEGIPTRSGKPWAAQTVGVILRREKKGQATAAR